MTIHGDDYGAGRPEPGQAAAAAILRAFGHRHEIAHLLYTATDEADATGRITDLLNVDPDTVRLILDQPFRALLPEHRNRLLAMAEAGAPTTEAPDELPLAIPAT